MARIEVEAVAPAELDEERLWGRNLELPRPGERAEGRALAVAGWALGRGAPAVAVEVVHDGAVARRTPVDIPRPDVAAFYPGVAEAGRSGFRATVGVLPGAAGLELQVRAVLRDHTRVPLGTIRVGSPGAGAGGEDPLVSVVVPCYNQAHFLGEALGSVLAQTYPHVEAVVVDDGSADNTAVVAARYPGVRLVRQANGGLAAARNAGLRASAGRYLVFLDADDRLLPDALAVGVAALEARPEAALAYGRHRLVGFDASPLAESPEPQVEGDHYGALLRCNYIGMHAAVTYRRAVLEAVGGFDSALPACEDYDLYLRIARAFPIHGHGQVVAEYRQHGANMTRDASLMLRAALTVLRAQRRYVRGHKQHEEAYRIGAAFWQAYYGEPLIHQAHANLLGGTWRQVLSGLRILLYDYPRGISPLQALGIRQYRVPVGRVRFGTLRRVMPISSTFGFDRGQPIDRYYIENFLARYRGDVQGHVLEIGDNAYTRQFGGSRVTVSDVLHVSEGNPKATFVADLTCADHIPADTFDCVICTQTLQLTYDLRSAIQTLYRILKPGGVLLMTVPGITQIDREEWHDYWCWSFTTTSTRRLIEEEFPAEAVIVGAHGNVLAAIAFLHGLAATELHQTELDYRDPVYEVLITARAVKPKIVRRNSPLRNEALESYEENYQRKHHLTQARKNASMNQRALILLYHRVTELHTDPWGLSVTPRHFAEHLAILQKHFQPIALQRLSPMLRDGSLPQRSVVVTFDDGYADNLHEALPLLERQGIPATFFLSTGSIAQTREFWWDELERLLLPPGTLPSVLRLSINGSTYRWELGDATHYSEEAYQRHRHWKAWEEAPSARHMIYHSLWELLQPLSAGPRQVVLDELRLWCSAQLIGRSTHRALTVEEVSALAQGDLFEVGAHTVTHPALSWLQPAAQQGEIEASKTYLEEVLRRPVMSFAYPYGRQCDYSADTVSVVREAGFTTACSNFAGIVEQATDQFQLPRLHIQDWDGEEFANQLSRWFHG